MSFLTDASLVFIPSGYKEDKAYSIKPTDGSGDLTFARASDGTRVNSEGYVERVPWNLLQQSNTFNTTWTKTNTSVSSGQSGYDGSLNAWLLTRTNTSGNLWQSVSLSGVQTFSVRLKKNTLDWVAILTNNTGNNGTYFNLNTGTQGTQGTNVTSSSIESIGNGWYLCSITLNVSTTAIYVYPAQGDLNVGGSSGSIYIQDAQLNEGTLKPYFPTTNRQDVPRLDYSNGCPCLLLEPQRTNLLTYSEQFDNGAWNKINVTVSSNTAVAPDGTTTADIITATAANGEIGQFLIQSTVDYTITFYVKSATSNPVDIKIGGQSSSATFTAFTATNEWTRVTSTVLSLGGSRGSRVVIVNSGDSILLWGAQLEAGSYPTSYIPTTSASVTRVADSASDVNLIPTGNKATLFISLNGNDVVTDRTVCGFRNGTTNQYALYFWGSDNDKFGFNSWNNDCYGISNSTIFDGDTHKIAAVFDFTDFTKNVLYIDGVKQSISQVRGTTLQRSANKVSLIAPQTNQYPIQAVEQFLYFNSELTNEQLEYLTGNSYSTYATMASQLNYTIQ